MDRLIRKEQKNGIMILAAVTGLIGAVAGSMGLYLRTELTTSETWDQGWIPQFTNGYFGVMSGYILFLLGTVGYSLVYARIFYLVLGYGFLSLSCDVLCVLDALMVLPYTNDYGRFAWDEHKCPNSNNTTNSTITPIPITESCGDTKIIAILLICVTIAVLMAFVLSTATTVVTSVALCRARTILDSNNQPPVELSPYSPEDFISAINFDNVLYQNRGFRP